MADEFTKAALYGIKTFNKKVIEKIGMEKLVELLNERKGSKHYYAANGSIRMVGQFPMSELELISKKFGFIKWLVENDKIDREKFGNSETKSSKYSDFELSYDTPREDYTNILLMELSISDTPIEDLINYLK